MEALTLQPESGLQQATAALIAQYITQLDVKPRTRESYRAALKHFTLWAAERGTPATSKADIIAYREHLTASYKPATAGAYLTALKGLYTHLEAEKLYPNIAAGVKQITIDKESDKEALTKEETNGLLESMAGESLAQLRDFAIVNLLVRTGLRTIEIQRADIGDMRKGLLHVQGKGRDSKDAFVVLTKATMTPIQAYLDARGTTDNTAPLFAAISNRNSQGRMTTRSLSRLIKAALRGSGIDSVTLTAHSLRHTAVTLSLLAGVSVQATQKMARHKDINTTLRYAHNIDRIKNAPERRIDAYLAARPRLYA
jgi:site-specific recombinase XerD